MIRSPSLSIIIPTLNSASVLEKCLKSIADQDYPKDKVKIIVADGESTDKTLTIAKRYKAKIINNRLKTGEAGKACGVKHAKGDLIALIDSDNILPDVNWLKLMVKPFNDPSIILAEPITYTYRREDPFLTRYFALLGMNDPICLFLGNYDRYSYLTGKWTNFNFSEEDFKDYLKVKLDHEPLPTIGANGTLIRRSVMLKYLEGDYLFDIDIILKILRREKTVYIAKVKTGIIHTFVEKSPTKFFRKQRRRIEDMSYYSKNKVRETNWQKTYIGNILYFSLQCLLVFPIFYQTIKGMIKKPDLAWFFHPIACYSTLIIYSYSWIKSKIIVKESDRTNWSQ